MNVSKKIEVCTIPAPDIVGPKGTYLKTSGSLCNTLHTSTLRSVENFLMAFSLHGPLVSPRGEQPQPALDLVLR